MSTVEIPRFSAQTPFLKGVPNSLISPEWFRLLTTLAQVGINTQSDVSDLQGNDFFFQDVGANEENASALAQQAADQIQQLMEDASTNNPDVLSQQALDLSIPESAFSMTDDLVAMQAAQQAIDQLQQMLEEAQDTVAKAMQALQDALVEQNLIVDVIRSMAQQESNNVAISGGKIDGTTIGATTPAAGTHTTITLTTAAPTASAGQVGFGSTTASTVGAAGAATALPANPLGYLIINVAGTSAKLPYYNA